MYTNMQIKACGRVKAAKMQEWWGEQDSMAIKRAPYSIVEEQKAI